MTVKDFRKLCKEHNAMDYAMVIANSRLRKEYHITIKNLRVDGNCENVYILFDTKDKKEYWTTDCATVKEFLSWSGSFKNYNISPVDIAHNIQFGWINESDVKFWDEDKVVQLYFI